MPKPEHILVIRLSAMGDVAITVPLLRAFVKQYPQVKLTVLTKPQFKPIFNTVPEVQVVPVYINTTHKGILGIYTLSKQLKTLKISAIADLHDSLRSRILKQFLKVRTIKIDKGRVEKKALVSGKKVLPLKSTLQRYEMVFSKLGYPVDLSAPSFPKPLKLNSYQPKTKKWIGIAPFAAHKGKMYPLNLMKTVVQELSQEHQIFLFGSLQESKTLSTFEKTFKNTISLAGKSTFDEELIVLSHLDLMLSMDSGNAHLAAMFGIKVITIWGVTHPFAGFAPFNQPEEYCLLANREKFPKIPTSIYGNKYPKSYEEASGSISPSTIIDNVLKIL